MHIKKFRNIIHCAAILLCTFTHKSFPAETAPVYHQQDWYYAADFVPTPRPFPSLLKLALAQVRVRPGKSLKSALKDGNVPDDLNNRITDNTITDENRHLKIQVLLIASPIIPVVNLFDKIQLRLFVDGVTEAAMETWLNLVSTGKTTATNSSQKNLLHRLLFVGACHRDTSIPVITLLIYAGADPNIATELGETPLQMARFHNAQNATQALRNAGANPREVEQE